MLICITFPNMVMFIRCSYSVLLVKAVEYPSPDLSHDLENNSI